MAEPTKEELQGFDLTTYGVRVPAVLVSPWITAGTVYRAPGWENGYPSGQNATPFDHTSILSTVEKRFGLMNLTARDKAAPDLGGVVTLASARTDDPLSKRPAPKAAQQPTFDKAPSHLELAFAQLASHLPITDKTGDIRATEIPPVRSGDEALAFAHQRNKEHRKSRDRFEKQIPKMTQ
jgi:phospholipase C